MRVQNLCPYSKSAWMLKYETATNLAQFGHCMRSLWVECDTIASFYIQLFTISQNYTDYFILAMIPFEMRLKWSKTNEEGGGKPGVFHAISSATNNHLCKMEQEQLFLL